MFGVGVGMTSLLTLLTPLAAVTNVWVLVALRILEGIFEVRYFINRFAGTRGTQLTNWRTSIIPLPLPIS